MQGAADKTWYHSVGESMPPLPPRELVIKFDQETEAIQTLMREEAGVRREKGGGRRQGA
jgi:hypothetical protein